MSVPPRVTPGAPGAGGPGGQAGLAQGGEGLGGPVVQVWQGPVVDLLPGHCQAPQPGGQGEAPHLGGGEGEAPHLGGGEREAHSTHRTGSNGLSVTKVEPAAARPLETWVEE